MSTTSHIAFQRKNSFTVSYSVYDISFTYLLVILVSSNLIHARFICRRIYFRSGVQFQPSDSCKSLGKQYSLSPTQLRGLRCL